MCPSCSRRWHGWVKLGRGCCPQCVEARGVRVMVDEHPGESRDGTGSGDHDTPWTPGHPCACLTIMQQARLLIMRGYVLDHRAGEPGGPSEGDDDWVKAMDSGVLVPAEPMP